MSILAAMAQTEYHVPKVLAEIHGDVSSASALCPFQTQKSTPTRIRMFCPGSVLPVMLFFCTTSLLASMAVLYLVLNSPPPHCTEACETEESQASVVSLAPDLLLPLLAVITRHVPSVARYLVACMAWLWPLGILFLLPIAFVALLYFTAFLVQLYCLRDWLIGGLRGTAASSSGSSSSTEEPYLNTDHLLRRLVAVMWEAHGRAFHGYEVVGMEKLPAPGEGAFLVYYHGTIPLDAYYFIARHIIKRNRLPIPVVDRFLFRLPGLQRILRLTCALEGSVEECVALLNPTLAESSKSLRSNSNSNNPKILDARNHDAIEIGETSTRAEQEKEQQEGDEEMRTVSSQAGEVLLLSPGGVREALFSDEYYSVLWGKRRGFARIAIKAKRPIYPVFTENIREGIRLVQYGKCWLRRLYEFTRLPFGLFYGYFPVKLRTHIGDPIYPRIGETDEQLADRTREAIEDMILRYQWRPGNVVIALLQRFPCFDAWVQSKNAQNYHSRRRKDSQIIMDFSG
ncbi:Transmembrane protein 68 [Echinococcus granulosus]|uniref:Transmembrane protein 68 n=1 Tax=Echinococcus granulosus TaxID=6210 RepID=A0A068WUI2_ECHGR|nr:Transmembrane protein 68 [Echinococcus granulosus]CDS21328.1 transmembrane protein 68 [Echinococcus granulosus]